MTYWALPRNICILLTFKDLLEWVVKVHQNKILVKCNKIQLKQLIEKRSQEWIDSAFE